MKKLTSISFLKYPKINKMKNVRFILVVAANLSTGIYFYSLEVNGIKTDTKKMTLIR